MQANEDVIRRIKKVLALAERGIDGEKVAAQAMLDKLLKKYDMTLDDIVADEAKREWVELSFSGEYEEKLLNQLVAMITNLNDFRSSKLPRTRSKRWYQLTPGEHIEVEFMFAILKKALHIEMGKMLSAFIHTNKLYAARRDDDDTEAPEISAEEHARLRQVAAMMAVMAPVEIRKAICNS